MNEEKQKLKAQAYDLVCEIEEHQVETKQMIDQREQEFKILVKKRQLLHKEMNEK